MKKINILYVALIPLLYFVYRMNVNLSGQSILFYGFAENKETELSHDEHSLIHEILVTPGQSVQSGELLVVVQQADIEFKKNSASRDLERLRTIDHQRIQEIKDRIDQLDAQKLALEMSIQQDIANLEASILFNKKLVGGLKSFEKDSSYFDPSPSEVKLASLKKSLITSIRPLDVEKQHLKDELRTVNIPSKVLQSKLNDELGFYEGEENGLKILAPSDGIVGSILCKEGEHISAFTTLVNFYERNPTLVKGFIHEKQLLEVKEGDCLDVSSSLHVGNRIEGQVIGLGTRIVEIPERLRKIPEVKTYGREVLIRIPADNPFLQNEKVMLKTLKVTTSNPLLSLYSMFSINPLNSRKIQGSRSYN